MSALKPTRAVIYTRVSSTRNRPDLRSFEDQINTCRRLISQRGWEVVDTIKDPDRAGSTLERPGLNQARKLIRDGHAEVIVVYKFDRFARTMVKAMLVLGEIQEDGGDVVSAFPTESHLDTTTPIGKGIAALLFSIAENDLVRIRTDFRNASEAAVEKGWYMGGRFGAPFGYLKPGPKQPLVPHPVNAELVRGLFTRSAQGESYGKLRTYLLEHDVRMSQPSIRTLLQNRAYLGEMNWGGSRAPRPGRPVVNPPIVNLAAHEPLVDELLWKRAQRNGTKFGLGRTREDPALLAGLARCAGCRSTLGVNRGQGKRAPYYFCRNASLSRDLCAGPASITMAHLDGHVNEWMVEWLRAWRLEVEDDGGEEDLRSLDQQIDHATMRRSELRSESAQELLGDDWLPELRRRDQKIKALEAERGELLLGMNLPEILARLREPEDYLQLSDDKKRIAIGSMIGIVFVRVTSRRGPGASSPAGLADRIRVLPIAAAEIIESLPRPGHETVRKPFRFDKPESTAGEPLGEIG